MDADGLPPRVLSGSSLRTSLRMDGRAADLPDAGLAEHTEYTGVPAPRLVDDADDDLTVVPLNYVIPRSVIGASKRPTGHPVLFQFSADVQVDTRAAVRGYRRIPYR